MPPIEDDAGAEEVDLHLNDLARFYLREVYQGTSRGDSRDSLGDEEGAAIGVDVGNSHHQINVQLIELHIERPGQAPRNLQGIFERVGGVDERVVSLFDLPLITGPRVEGEVGTADSGRRVLGIEDVGIAHADWAYLRQDSARGGPE